MKKSLVVGILLVTAQNDNLEVQQMMTEAGLQGLCSAPRQTLPENNSALRQTGP